MRKVFALLLLCVHLGNLSGYLMTQYLIRQNEQEQIKSLDAHIYEDKNLVLIKVPLHLPYTSETKNFVRVNGQIELSGTWYSYVQRKISRDTLMLMCLPNHAKGKLVIAAAQLTSQNELCQAGKNHEPALKKAKSTDDYNISSPMLISFSLKVNSSDYRLSMSRLINLSVQEPAAEPPEA